MLQKSEGMQMMSLTGNRSQNESQPWAAKNSLITTLRFLQPVSHPRCDWSGQNAPEENPVSVERYQTVITLLTEYTQ